MVSSQREAGNREGLRGPSAFVCDPVAKLVNALALEASVLARICGFESRRGHA